MSVLATEAAQQQIRKTLENRKSGVGIKLGVRTTGCSGLAYTLEFADQLGEGDECFDQGGIFLIVSKKDMPYLSGMQLDYQRQGLNEGFVFENPNERNRCGCGESFTV